MNAKRRRKNNMCDEKKIIDDVKETVEELDKAAEEAAEAVGDAVEDAADKLTDAAGEALEEPIAHIEKTVDDLKKKIEEITEKNEPEDEEKEHRFSIPEFSLNEEQKEKLNDLKTTAAAKADEIKDKAAAGFDEVKDKARELRDNVDLDKTVDFIKNNAVKAVGTAKKAYGDLKEDPRVQQAADAAKNAKDAAAKFLDEHIPEETQAKAKEGFDKAKSAVGEGINTVKEKVSDPETQEKVKSFTGMVAETFKKGIAKVKGLFEKK